jgi:hypothetical protein
MGATYRGRLQCETDLLWRPLLPQSAHQIDLPLRPPEVACRPDKSRQPIGFVFWFVVPAFRFVIPAGNLRPPSGFVIPAGNLR